jgi:cell division protein FtsL
MTAAALAYEPSFAPSAHSRGIAAPAARTVPAPAPSPRRHQQPWERLQIAPRRSRVRFTTLGLAVVVALMAAAALVGPMLVNVAGMRVEWRLAQLDDKQDTLVSERASLSAQAAALGSTPRILEEAQKLGMVPATHVNYLALPGAGPASTTSSTSPGGGGAKKQP